MSNVCFGLLDVSDSLSIPAVAEKVLQLTRLTIAKHFQTAPFIEAKTVDEILKRATRENHEYLVIIKSGIILHSPKIIEKAIKDLFEHKTTVKGELIKEGENYYLSDNLLIVNRSWIELLSLSLKWGESHSHATSPVQTMTGDMTSKQILTRGGGDHHLTFMTREGWGLIKESLSHNTPVLTWGVEDYQHFTDMEPHVGTEALYDAIRSPFTLNLTRLSLSQLYVISEYSWANSSRQFVEVYDTGNSHGVWKTQIEIMKLYSTASGFKPLQILYERGFNDNTVVTYFSGAESQLSFRRHMVENWDGTDFPTFLRQCAFDLQFRFNAVLSDTSAWEDVLKTFGGPRAFKVFWDKYRQLKHVYRMGNVVAHPESWVSGVVDDPRSHMWWGDEFANVNMHLEYDAIHISEQFCWFINEIRKRNPHITLEGRNSYGLWF